MDDYTHFLGIDIAKDFFDIALLQKQSKETLEPQNFKMNQKGFKQLIDYLGNHIDSNQSVFMVMESTGSYHLKLLDFLVNKDFNIALVNPKLIKSFMDSRSLRRSSNDIKSAKNIAHYAQRNYFELSTVTPDEITSLKPLIREREHTIKQITQEKNQLRNYLDRVFPELSDVTNLFSKTVLNMLKEAPSAKAIQNKGLEFVEKALNSTNGGRIKASPEKIFEAAQNSIGLSDQNLEQIIVLKINKFLELKNSVKEIDNLLKDQITINHKIKKNVEILTSIKGIGFNSAISFLIEAGIAGTNIANVFPSHKQIIAYAGTDPVIKESGDSINQHKSISKQGNPHLRKIIYTMSSTVKNHGYFNHYYNKKRNEGKTYHQAIIAVGNKLLKVLYSLLKNETLYDLDYHLSKVDWIAA